MRTVFTTFVLAIALALSACTPRLQPVKNPERPLPSSARQHLSLEELGDCLRQVARRNDWLDLPGAQPGYLPLYRQVRSHEMEVDLHYDRESIRAEYKHSENLLFKERDRLARTSESRKPVVYEGPVIHRTYNQEVIQLFDAIQTAVSMRDGAC